MTKEETYPLHRFIFRNDVEGLNNSLKDKEMKKLINSKDNHGNTPIHLAIMLDRRNCVLSLMRNGCDVVTRNNFGWNPLEEATMLGDMDLVEKLTFMKFRDYNNFFNKRGGLLDQWTEQLPYYHIKCQFKFKSKIPFLDKIGIKDVEHLYKRGNDFRLDFGFSGIDLRGIPRMMKGSMSFVINFKENGTLRIYLLDNKAKRYTEIFPEMPQRLIESYLKTKMNVKTLYKFYVDNSELKIKKKSNKGFSFNNKKRTIRVGNKKYNTDIFKFKDIEVIIRKRDNEQIIGDYKSHIKTTVQDLDKSRNRGNLSKELNGTLFSGAEKEVNGYVMQDIMKQEIELSGTDDSDSDNDDSDIEETETDSNSDSNNESNEKLLIADNEFKKYIDKHIYEITSKNSDIAEKVVKMIIQGKDENGNAIESSDIMYINQILPSFFPVYIKDNNLSSEEQKKLEEIYNSVVGNRVTSDDEDSANTSQFVQDLKKSNNVTSMVHNLAENYYNSKKSSSSKSFKNEPIKKEAISEEEYFNPENKESLHMGRVMEISEEKRHIKNAFKFWMTKENSFPISCDHIKPLMDIVCLTLYDQVNVKVEDNDYDRTTYYNTIKYILKEVNGSKRFPLKFEIPVYTATVFQFKYLDVETTEKSVPEHLFKIPSDYVYDETVSFRFIK